MTKAYGIDFGTTNTTIAIFDGGKVIKIPVDRSAENSSIMRSIIYVNDKLEFKYGKLAIDSYGQDVKKGKGRVKKAVYTGRYITVAGRADVHGVLPDEIVEELIEFDEFQGGRMLQSLKSFLSKNNISGVNLFGKILPLEVLVGGFLKELKSRADEYIGEELDSVVVGRPVKYVGDSDRKALERMKQALKIAGFKNISFEFEPIAAAYDYETKTKLHQTVLIFDFGGGTLDISVVRFPEKLILANVGLPLGGDFFNSRIFTEKLSFFFGKDTRYGPNKVIMPSYIYESLKNWYSATLLKDEKFDEQMDHFRFMNTDPEKIDALRSLVNNNLSFALYDEIDRVKRNLTRKDSDTLKFVEDHIDITANIQKSFFEKIIQDNILEIDKLVEDALKKAKVSSENINAVATTGGSSLIPIVRQLLINKFGKKKIIESDAFTSVAGGLALRAYEKFN